MARSLVTFSLLFVGFSILLGLGAVCWEWGRKRGWVDLTGMRIRGLFQQASKDQRGEGNQQDDHGKQVAQDSAWPSGMKLRWFAPVFSGGGYCSEAIAFLQGFKALGAEAGFQVAVTPHGDSFNEGFLRGLPSPTYDLLSELYHSRLRPDVVVCHSEPGAWNVLGGPNYDTTRCPPSDSPPGWYQSGRRFQKDEEKKHQRRRRMPYRIGRTMFETDRLPEGWEGRVSEMDEVWVPSYFQQDIFIEAGVEPTKIQVIGEPVDTQFFDPKEVRRRLQQQQQEEQRGEALSGNDLHLVRYLRGKKSNRRGSGGRGGDEDGEGEREGKQEPTHTSGGGDWVPLESQQEEEGEGEGGGRKFGSTDGGQCVFLSVFKWEERKGWDVLLEAYLTAFSKDDAVKLVLLTNAYHDSDPSSFWKRIEDFAVHKLELATSLDDLPPLSVIGNVPQVLMPALYMSVDALVIPSRGEGWGRPHVEAMAMELPVLATNWSGPTMFMREDWSYPLRVERLVEVQSGPFQGHKWAHPSVDFLRETLRSVAANPREARARGGRARQEMERSYAPEVMAREVRGHVARIQQQLAVELQVQHGAEGGERE